MFDYHSNNQYICSHFLRKVLKSMMKIKISNLANGDYDFDFEGPIEEIDISEPFTGNFKTKALLTKFEDQIILTAETLIDANLVCDRCGSEITRQIKSSYKVVYLLRNNEYDEDLIDTYFIHPDSDSILIDNDVRDFAVLSIPMKTLCTENCKGLCKTCGANLNEESCNCTEEKTDPRWEPLLKLKKQQNTN